MEALQRGLESQPAQGQALEPGELASGELESPPRLLCAQRLTAVQSVAELDHPPFVGREPFHRFVDGCRDKAALGFLEGVGRVRRKHQPERRRALVADRPVEAVDDLRHAVQAVELLCRDPGDTRDVRGLGGAAASRRRKRVLDAADSAGACCDVGG